MTAWLGGAPAVAGLVQARARCLAAQPSEERCHLPAAQPGPAAASPAAPHPAVPPTHKQIGEFVFVLLSGAHQRDLLDESVYLLLMGEARCLPAWGAARCPLPGRWPVAGDGWWVPLTHVPRAVTACCCLLPLAAACHPPAPRPPAPRPAGVTALTLLVTPSLLQMSIKLLMRPNGSRCGPLGRCCRCSGAGGGAACSHACSRAAPPRACSWPPALRVGDPAVLLCHCLLPPTRASLDKPSLQFR